MSPRSAHGRTTQAKRTENGLGVTQGSTLVFGGNAAVGVGVIFSLLGHSLTQTSASRQPVSPPGGLRQGQSHTEAQENQGRAVLVPLPGLQRRQDATPVACFACFLSWSDLPHCPTAVPLLSTYEYLPQIPFQTLSFHLRDQV